MVPSFTSSNFESFKMNHNFSRSLAAAAGFAVMNPAYPVRFTLPSFYHWILFRLRHIKMQCCMRLCRKKRPAAIPRKLAYPGDFHFLMLRFPRCPVLVGQSQASWSSRAARVGTRLGRIPLNRDFLRDVTCFSQSDSGFACVARRLHIRSDSDDCWRRRHHTSARWHHSGCGWCVQTFLSLFVNDCSLAWF